MTAQLLMRTIADDEGDDDDDGNGERPIENDAHGGNADANDIDANDDLNAADDDDHGPLSSPPTTLWPSSPLSATSSLSSPKSTTSSPSSTSPS